MFCLWVGKGFLGRTQKIVSIKEKNTKFNLMKIKKFHSSKYIVKKMNMYATDWEKMLALHMYDRGLVSRTLINNL